MRARNQCILAVVTVSESFEDAKMIWSLSQQESFKTFLLPSAGLHPVPPLPVFAKLKPSALEECQHRIDQLREQVELMLNFIRQHQEDLVCIGEVGLDYSRHIMDSSLEAEYKLVQQKVFQKQILLANELHLPLNVHSRNAGHYALTMIVELCGRDIPVLMHAFDGKSAYALKALEQRPENLYFSVPPSIVRSDSMKRLVRLLPLERLVLESDAPALSPTAGTVNEPMNIMVAVDCIASLKKVAREEILKTCFENSLQLFPKLKATLKLKQNL